ncbi:hypothetical protein [Microseira sp. BLCC-F43]|uniref:hypothetical protein n=1 Tax=Microseira sp. BLCC-F43 TaxID=3153602 RepID=UPI0035B712F3
MRYTFVCLAAPLRVPLDKRSDNAFPHARRKPLYFVKSARELQAVPQVMGIVPEIQQAFTIANQTNLSPEELEDLERREIFIQDMRGAMTKAVNQGIQQGIQQGAKDAQIEIAQRLLNILDVETISQTTGLSIEEIQSLRTAEGE